MFVLPEFKKLWSVDCTWAAWDGEKSHVYVLRQGEIRLYSAEGMVRQDSGATLKKLRRYRLPIMLRGVYRLMFVPQRRLLLAESFHSMNLIPLSIIWERGLKFDK